MPASETTEQVFAVEDQRFVAMSRNDVVTLAELLPDDLHYVHANGMVEDKAEFLRKITSGERQYRHFAATKREAHHEGDFTFVFGEADVEVDRAAGKLKNKLTYTAVYRNRPAPQLYAWHAVKSLETAAG